jgi:hypothetical protein
MPSFEWYAVAIGNTDFMQKVLALLDELNRVEIDTELKEEIHRGNIMLALVEVVPDGE